eukprot:4630682-Pyramimonas_sp.AAC.1
MRIAMQVRFVSICEFTQTRLPGTAGRVPAGTWSARAATFGIIHCGLPAGGFRIAIKIAPFLFA